MKKILALCISVIMLLSLSTTAFAAEMWDESAGSGETEIYAHIYSSYTITIPATIDLREGGQCEVKLTNPNIEPGYQINVYCTNITNDNAIRLENVNVDGEGINCYLTNVDGMAVTVDDPLLVWFKQSDIINEETIKYFSMTYDRMGMAGDYSGIMQYSFECAPI